MLYNMVKAVIIDKSGNLSTTNISSDNIDELYKKCNFRKSNGFEERVAWNVKYNNDKYQVKLYARNEGKHNLINSFEFPPPIDKHLFYGSCITLAYVDNKLVDMDENLWNKLYEKLYGGFESLKDTAEEDEKEIDELENVPKNMKIM